MVKMKNKQKQTKEKTKPEGLKELAKLNTTILF